MSSQAKGQVAKEPFLPESGVTQGLRKEIIEARNGHNGQLGADLSARHHESRLLGEMLVEQRKITPAERDKILHYARKKHWKFGEAAIKLRLASRTDIRHCVAAQFDYPFLKKGEGGHSDQLWAAYDPFSPAGEKFRNLRAQLLLHWDQSGNRAVVVVGPDKGSLSSLIAANLAVTFSQSGASTLLVDADLRNSGQRRFFSLDHDIGLSLVLLNRMSLDRAIHRLPEFRDLSILPSGAVPPNPSDLLVRKQWTALIDELQQHYDVLIFDAPAFTADGGAEMIARVCGSAIVTLRRHQTRLADAKQLTESIQAVGTEVVGAVLAGS